VALRTGRAASSKHVTSVGEDAQLGGLRAGVSVLEPVEKASGEG
jgi:hypothetical protein